MKPFVLNSEELCETVATTFVTPVNVPAASKQGSKQQAQNHAMHTQPGLLDESLRDSETQAERGTLP